MTHRLHMNQRPPLAHCVIGALTHGYVNIDYACQRTDAPIGICPTLCGINSLHEWPDVWIAPIGGGSTIPNVCHNRAINGNIIKLINFFATPMLRR